jgi:hypothetical protein
MARFRARHLAVALWTALALLLAVEAYTALVACGVSLFGFQAHNCPAPAPERAPPSADFDDLLRRIGDAEARLAERCRGDLVPLQIPEPPPADPLSGADDGIDSPLLPLLLLLPLLFAFLYGLKKLLYSPKKFIYWPKNPISFFGARVETANIIVLFDVSGSMSSVLNEVRDESARILGGMTADYHVNYIAFADSGVPLFSKLTRLDARTRDTIMAWLGRGDYLRRAGGGNDYEAGFKTAFEQSLKRGHPTTIILLTDGHIPLVDAITPGKTREQQLSSILSWFADKRLAARTKAAALRGQIIIKVPKVYYSRDIPPNMKALVEAFNGA